MRIVTYNVNGLRARVSSHGCLLSLLNSLHADIICLQEIKLSRQELTADIAIAKGYESFFSCNQASQKGRIGYSGVATFCKVDKISSSTSAILPVAADEGFTGLLHCSKTGEIVEGCQRVGCYDEIWNMKMTKQEMLSLDSEGRCIITDHGSFVLFNIYGPNACIKDKQRMQFKLKFFQLLQCRWEGLLRKGRRIIVAGDLNISPYAIDSCNPAPEFHDNPCRKWLRSMMKEEGGSFVDVFRAVHPVRREAFTCWCQASGAEEFNWGTRIDLFLAAGPCQHQISGNAVGTGISSRQHDFTECEVVDCDILLSFRRFKPDSLPRWVDGRSLKLEGSDHAPVFMMLKEQPCVQSHNAPLLAARFLPELRGQQQSIVSLLQKKSSAVGNSQLQVETECQKSPSNSCKVPAVVNSDNRYDFGTKKDSSDAMGVETWKCMLTNSSNVGSTTQFLQECTVSGENSHELISPSLPMPMGSWNSNNELSVTIKKRMAAKSKAKKSNATFQRNLKTFFPSKRTATYTKVTVEGVSELVSSDSACSIREVDDATTLAIVMENKSINMSTNQIQGLDTNQGVHSVTTNISSADWPLGRNQVDGNNQIFDETANSELSSLSKDDPGGRARTIMVEWKRIQNLMADKRPLCRGHGEPSVVRIVKKPGPNMGRGFYVCARAEGPASNPEARCNHFEWASSKGRNKKF